MARITLTGLSPQEQDKALLGASFSLVERYARSGTDRFVLVWLREKLQTVLGELNNNIRKIDEDNRPPFTGKVIKVRVNS